MCARATSVRHAGTCSRAVRLGRITPRNYKYSYFKVLWSRILIPHANAQAYDLICHGFLHTLLHDVPIPEFRYDPPITNFKKCIMIRRTSTIAIDIDHVGNPKPWKIDFWSKQKSRQNDNHSNRPGGTCVYTHIYMQNDTPLNLDGIALGII